MKTKKFICIITTFLIICLLSTCDAFSTKGRWNPLDPDYESTTDPDAPSSEYKDEFRWDFTTSTDGWGYGESYGQDINSQIMTDILAGRITISQQNISSADSLVINIDTDLLTAQTADFSIKCDLLGSILSEPYFSMRLWVSQTVIDTNSTVPQLRIDGGKEGNEWFVSTISLLPTASITEEGWYNYKANILNNTYESMGTPTFTDLSGISITFNTTANPSTGDFCYIDYMRLATTEDPDM